VNRAVGKSFLREVDRFGGGALGCLGDDQAELIEAHHPDSSSVMRIVEEHPNNFVAHQGNRIWRYCVNDWMRGSAPETRWAEDGAASLAPSRRAAVERAQFTAARASAEIQNPPVVERYAWFRSAPALGDRSATVRRPSPPAYGRQ
jgi:hypothetical protein